MCDTLVHRGPDGEGIGVAQHVALGMRRLSIIDVEGGWQPIFNEDRSIRVTLNGEIYNYRELREELRAAGHHFYTRSDTEVIVHAYEEYGDDFLNRLNGMFALALHDSARQRVILARDHLGIKPLFYAITPDVIVWGSEVKAILASGLVPRSLDADALLEFCSWEYVPGENTLLREVRKLCPGHMLQLDSRGNITGPREFWDVPRVEREDRASDELWLERLDATITTSVRRQLVSDVPLGAFLSGGVDSSLVVAAMGPARTFSIGFDDPTYNELDYSRDVAAHLGTEHVTRVIQPRVAGLFDRLMHYMDDPIGDFSIFPTFLVSQLARESVTVALSGDGGDEVFGGYETYVAQEMAARYERLPHSLRSLISVAGRVLPPSKKKKGLVNKVKRFIEGYEHPASLGHARWRLFLSGLLRESLFSEDFRRSLERSPGQHIWDLQKRGADFDDVTRGLYVDVKSYLVDNCLVKADRMSMAVSLEVRVPLLDTDVVALGFSMPSRLKLHNGKTKWLLKRLAATKVPARCIWRPKEGFSIPLKNWLGSDFRPILERYTEPGLLRRDGIFDANVVAGLKAEHLAGRANHSHLLWAVIVFNAWQERWLNGDVTHISAPASAAVFAANAR